MPASSASSSRRHQTNTSLLIAAQLQLERPYPYPDLRLKQTKQTHTAKSQTTSERRSQPGGKDLETTSNDAVARRNTPPLLCGRRLVRLRVGYRGT
jgi:hypothetical protein